MNTFAEDVLKLADLRLDAVELKPLALEDRQWLLDSLAECVEELKRLRDHSPDEKILGALKRLAHSLEVKDAKIAKLEAQVTVLAEKYHRAASGGK